MPALVQNLDEAIEAIEESIGEDLPDIPEGVGHVDNAGPLGMTITGPDLTPRQQALIADLKEELDGGDEGIDGDEDITAVIEHRKEVRQQLIDGINEHRYVKQEQCYDIAQSWSKKPDLTPAERCHGVAWEIQKNFGDTFGADNNGTVIVADVGAEYALLYESMQHDNIRQGLAKSAAALFS